MIFVSYQYTASQHGQIYQGYGNGLLNMDCPTDEETLEEANQRATNLTIKKNGFDTASAVIISIKEVKSK